MREALRRVFENPPKGGNEVGVQTASSMAPLPGPMGSASRPVGAYDGGKSLQAQREERELASIPMEKRFEFQMTRMDEERARQAAPSGPQQQTSYRESFEKGEQAARNNVVQSGRVGQPEFRNYDRGRIPAQGIDEQSAPNYFDLSATLTGTTGRVGEVPASSTGTNPKPSPSYRPDTRMPVRSDGKPNFTMGVPPSGNTGGRSDVDNDWDDTNLDGGLDRNPTRGLHR